MRHVNNPNVRFVTDVDGRRWPIPAGGSDDTPLPATDGGDGGDAPVADGDAGAPPAGDPDALGDPGKRALEAERQARKDAEKAAKDLAKQLDEVRKSQMDEHERAIADARESAAAETAAKYASRLAAARAEALAAAKTHDPDAAVQLLGDLTTFVTEDGDVDTAAMAEALDALVEAKPYLKADAATAPVGGADQGRRPPPGPTQLTREDIKRMSPEEIVQAKAEGRLTSLLGSS